MFNEKTYNQKMDKTVGVFTKELTSLRTGRANANMLDLIKVDVYGQQMPINQVASITTPEPRMINIQVWDLNNVAIVDSAIKAGAEIIKHQTHIYDEEMSMEAKKIIPGMWCVFHFFLIFHITYYLYATSFVDLQNSHSILRLLI